MKKIIIASGELKKALAKVGQVINTKAPLPVLQNILCRVTVNQLELIGTNTEITIHYRIACESQEEAEFLMPYDFIHELISLKKNIPLEMEGFKTKVVIRDENGQYDGKTYGKLDEWPKLLELPKKASIEITTDEFDTMRTAVLTTGNGSIPLKGLTYVLLELQDGKIVIASSDGSYMVYSCEFASDQKEAEELLIAPKVIKLLEGEQNYKLFFHSKAIGFTTDNMTIVATRTEEKYVNFRSVFPQDWPANLTVNRFDLIEALNICSLAKDDLKSAKVTLDATTMKFAADDSKSNIHFKVGCNYTGTTPEVVINSEKFLKLLSQLEDEEINLALHDSSKAIVITSNSNQGYKGLLMPIATKSK